MCKELLPFVEIDVCSSIQLHIDDKYSTSNESYFLKQVPMSKAFIYLVRIKQNCKLYIYFIFIFEEYQQREVMDNNIRLFYC
jgi:hypothetical protein